MQYSGQAVQVYLCTLQLALAFSSESRFILQFVRVFLLNYTWSSLGGHLASTGNALAAFVEVQIAGLGSQLEEPSRVQLALGTQFGGPGRVQVAFGGQFEGPRGVQVALGGQLAGPSGAWCAAWRAQEAPKRFQELQS